MYFFVSLAQFVFSWLWPIILSYVSYRFFNRNKKENVRFVKVYAKKAEREEIIKKKEKKKKHTCKDETKLSEVYDDDSDTTDEDLKKPVIVSPMISKPHPLRGKLHSIGKLA
jgi:hypothetical protein